MVIDMNEVQVRTLEQVRGVLEGTQALQFTPAEDINERYGWIEKVLRRLRYRQLKRCDRGLVLRYLQRFSGFSRPHLTRLVKRCLAGEILGRRYRAPAHAFARRYTGADLDVLVEVDREFGALSGPATVCVLRRMRDVFGDPRFTRLGSISASHLYNPSGTGRHVPDIKVRIHGCNLPLRSIMNGALDKPGASIPVHVVEGCRRWATRTRCPRTCRRPRNCAPRARRSCAASPLRVQVKLWDVWRAPAAQHGKRPAACQAMHMWTHDVRRPMDPARASRLLRVGLFGAEQARPVHVQKGVQLRGAERGELRRTLGGHVGVAELLVYHHAILGLHQRVVVAVARPRASELDALALEKFGHLEVHVLAATVGMEPQDRERELRQHLLEHGQHVLAGRRAC